MIISSVHDIAHHKIPNAVTFPAMLIGLACGLFLGGADGLVGSALGLLAGLGINLIPFALGWLGGGDVKLMAAVGSFLGAAGVFTAFLFTSLIGGAVSLAIILHATGLKKSLAGFWQFLLALFLTGKLCIPKPARGTASWFCYGPVIAAGTLGAMAWNATGHAYLTLF